MSHRIRLAIVMVLCASSALAGPEQRTLSGGDDGALEKMKAEGAKIIADAKASGAPYEQAVAAIYLAMRPRFGPANAALFGARDKKLQELAAALGEKSPADPGHERLDAWAEAVGVAEERLRKAGFQVSSEPGQSTQLGWMPRVFGRRLIVVDSNRTTTAVPYEALRKEPPKPANPRRTLWVLPRVSLRALKDLVSRQQPGELLGAMEGATVFFVDPPQGGDIDDGGLLASARAAIFPGHEPGEDPGFKRLKAGETMEGPGVFLRTLRKGADVEVELGVSK